MLNIAKFNKRFTLRKLRNYGNPVINPLDELRLPRRATLHYIDLDKMAIGPLKTLTVLEDLERYAVVRHHFDLHPNAIQGNPKKLTVEVSGDILRYHRQNPTLKRYRGDDKIIVKEDRVLFVENYTPLLSTYRYQEGIILGWYYKLQNLMETICNQMIDDAANYERQNYLMVNVGNVLPAYRKFLRNGSGKPNEEKLEKFHDMSLLWILELIKWLGEDNENSLFARASQAEIRRMNIIFTHKGGFVNINLGELLGWSSRDENGKVSLDQMQKRLYRTIYSLLTTPVFVTNAEVTPEGPEVNTLEENIEAHIEYEEDEEKIEKEIKEFDSNKFDENEEVDIEDDLASKPTEIVLEQTIDHKAIIKAKIEEFSRAGRMSDKQAEKLLKAAEDFEQSSDPYGTGETYAKAMEIKPAELEVKAKRLTTAPASEIETSWFENTTDQMDENYISKVYHKDILATVAGVQNFGAVVHKHRIEKRVSVTGAQEQHYLTIQPIGGDSVTVPFTLPVLDEDGNWTANSVKYSLRRQRVDLPIRKTGPDEVALTTFYGKTFVRRSSKVVDNKPKWLCDRISEMGVDESNKLITNLRFGNVFKIADKVPHDYASIAMRIDGFDSQGVRWSFNHKTITEHFDLGDKQLTWLSKNKMVPVGRGRGYTYVMGPASEVYKYDNKETTEPVGTITDVLNIDTEKMPQEVSVISILGKELTLAFVFAYYLGLEGMFQYFGLTFERFASSERLDKNNYDMLVKLSDTKYGVRADSAEQKLILFGLKKYLKVLPQYSEAELGRKDVYLNLLQQVDKLKIRYLIELDLMRTGFVDPMHLRILQKMKLPETFVGLVVKANEMLTTDHSNPEICREDMMWLRHQRLSGHVYKGMANAMRQYYNKPANSRKFELTDSMIWGEISQDPSVMGVQEANPVQAVKEKDVTTMAGTGGRSKITMTKNTRAYPEDDIGVTAGDSVDNGDVGITAFNSANPQFDNVDGVPTKFEKGKLPPIGSIMSYCVGLYPNALNDDDKRWNFINIQLGSAQSCEHATVTPFRTGTGITLAHRTSKKHARIAKQDGKVTEVTDTDITVKYKDGTEETYTLERWFGDHEGATYPHDMKTFLKKGDTFKADSVITYNSKHFEPDPYNPGQVEWKNGVLGLIAFPEGEPVFEDSHSISPSFAQKLGAETTKKEDVVGEFGQEIFNVLKIGDKVEPDTVLCTLADKSSVDGGEYSDEFLRTMSKVNSHSPRAEVDGYIDNIEVVYHGDIEDMSESVKAIVLAGDRRRKRAAKSGNGLIADNGSADGSYRIKGVPLGYGQFSIRFYITHVNPMAGADKAVMGAQMKTTVQSKMVGVNRTMSGRDLDGIFGRNGAEARMVNSLFDMGAANSISMTMGERVGMILNGETPPKF